MVNHQEESKKLSFSSPATVEKKKNENDVGKEEGHEEQEEQEEQAEQDEDVKQDVKQDKAGTQLKDKEIKRIELNPVPAWDVIKSIKEAPRLQAHQREEG